jgi:hypothetical protein
MKQSIYQRAKNNGCFFESTCVGCGIGEWERMMKGTRPANQKKVVKIALLAGVIDKEQAREEIKRPYYNPYTHHVSKNYIVYVNSSIEHFIKVP